MIATSCPHAEIVGRIRVQPLTPFLVRIEQRGPGGFDDRETFTVQHRGPGVGYTVTRAEGKTLIATPHYRVSVPNGARTFHGIRVEAANGQLIRKLGSNDLERSYLPFPSDLPKAWVLADHPRVAPPPWGALPPPSGQEHPHSGWDLTNSAPDLYVFFPSASGYERFRTDFLDLTGPVPLPPLYAFGLWYSRYHPYSEEAALQVIDRFRSGNIPLDVFVADTDWRVGASCGYAVNTNLFPDMARFIRRAHEKNVRLMYNDHPEPVGEHAMSPKELEFRRAGLTSLLELGADVWWFDRNWHTVLQSPVEGLNKEVWGMCLYHDVTRAHRPSRRPLIMSNVDGVNNGHPAHASHPAAHRYPVWWTGDTIAEWDYLRLGVQNGVDCGIHSLLPYVHEDLGGHHGKPDAEYYTRFMQFGAFSPVARIHSTANVSRYPWQYDEETERVVGDYFRLRYRLLPTIYSAAHEAHVSGKPILRRGDLEWPEFPEARDNTQYLFGDDLLVAPILAPANGDRVAQRDAWIPPGEWEDVWTGRTHRGPARIRLDIPLAQFPVFARRGGIVMTAPQRYFTQTARWDHVVLDAYVPSADGETVRRLYEDDGISTDYTNGHGSVTRIVLRREGSRVRLSAEPDGAAQEPGGKRTWTVRLHLPKGSRAGAMALNGRVLEPSAPPAMPFEGAGSTPPPESGPVFEAVVEGASFAEPLEVVLNVEREAELCTR